MKLLDNNRKEYKQNNFTVVKNTLHPQLIDFLYDYCKLRTDNLYLYKNNNINFPYRKSTDGTFDDEQVKNASSFYGDPYMEIMLLKMQDIVSYVTNKKLAPNYSYWRLYMQGSELKTHIDRPECELSTTLFVGSDIANYPDKDYNWPLFIRSKKKNIPVYLTPGDIIIYNGIKLKHWREPFEGNNHAQIFLHYNDLKNGKGKIFDNRLRIGLPQVFENNAN